MNYFKVRARHTEQTFAFDGGSRRAVLVAFDRAITAALRCGGRLSVCYPVALPGPWSTAPVIVPVQAQEGPAPKVEEPRLALWGEGGCW